MKLLITGGSGYIAKSLHTAFYQLYDVTMISRKDFDLTSYEAMSNFFEGKYFDVVIHCAVKGGSRLVKESFKDMDDNLSMYYNLLQHRSKYGKLIHFGSGAEFNSPESPYGLSKRVISKSISEIDNFYDIRIYAVFDENELDTRFIKSNILRYLNNESMIIHENKEMDFFYMKDLIKVVEYCIQTDQPYRSAIHCTYPNSYRLFYIANIINNLDTHRVGIEIEQDNGTSYTGSFNDLVLSYIGLEQGIQETYNKIKETYATN